MELAGGHFMKVNIYQTVEVSDEARKGVAALMGQKSVTREELKQFIWAHGEGWEAELQFEDRADELEMAEAVRRYEDGKPNVQVAEDLLGSATQGEVDEEFGDLL